LLLFGLPYCLLSGKAKNISLVINHLTGIFGALTDQDDTFVYRLRDSAGRFELIKKNPMLGIGFVHNESNLFAHYRGGQMDSLDTGDSGLTTFLLHFGIFGLVWLIWFSVVFIKELLKGIKRHQNENKKSFLAAVFSFFIGQLVAFATLGLFTTYNGIITFTIVLGLTRPYLIKKRRV